MKYGIGKFHRNPEVVCEYARVIGRSLGCKCEHYPEYRKYLDDLERLSIDDRFLYWFFFPYKGKRISAMCQCCQAIMGYEKVFDEIGDRHKQPEVKDIGDWDLYREFNYDHTTAEVILGCRLANGLLVVGQMKLSDYQSADLNEDNSETFAMWKVITLGRPGELHAYLSWFVTAQDDGWKIQLQQKSQGLKLLTPWLYDDLQF